MFICTSVAVTVSFDKSSYIINKLLPPPTAKLRLSQSLPNDVTINITDQAGTATGKLINVSTSSVLMTIVLSAGKDYRSRIHPVTFTKGSKSISFPLLIYPLDDEIVEEDETFNITIDSASLPNGVSLGDPCIAIVTIKDDDSK